MKETPAKKDNSFLYIISTITFIFLGIILSSVINQSKSKDVRARASAISGVAATGVISEIKSDTNVVIVNNLAFASSPQSSMGSWIVTPPTTFKLDSISVGNAVSILIEPSSLAIEKHTFTAKEIKKK